MECSAAAAWAEQGSLFPKSVFLDDVQRVVVEVAGQGLFRDLCAIDWSEPSPDIFANLPV